MSESHTILPQHGTPTVQVPEWRYALAERGIEFIHPVPLVPPDRVPPPPELAALHFNDSYLAFLKERQTSIAEQAGQDDVSESVRMKKPPETPGVSLTPRGFEPLSPP
jgi:hypothetical protein